MAASIEVSGSELRYELIGAEHLGAIDEAWSARVASPGLSRHPVFRGYIEGFRAARPAGLAWAGALVIAALFSPGRVVEFSLPGGELRLLQPPPDGVAVALPRLMHQARPRARHLLVRARRGVVVHHHDLVHPPGGEKVQHRRPDGVLLVVRGEYDRYALVFPHGP